MIRNYEHEMICDLAETYHIYDYKAMPPRLLRTLVAGLGADSRVSMSMRNSTVGLSALLMAHILDGVRVLAWQRSVDGSKGVNAPESIAEVFSTAKKTETISYNTIEGFEEARNRIIKEVKA